MSMQENNEELPPEHQNLPPEVQAMLRQGRKAQRDLEVERERAQKAELQAAIAQAGLPDHPAREVVFAAYEGTLDADAIKAHAEKFGITSESVGQAQGPTEQELAAQRAILNAGGGPPAASGDVDLAVALRNAKTKDEVLAIVGQMAGQPGFRNHDGMIGVLPEY